MRLTGSTVCVSQADNTVLLGLWHMLAAHFFESAGGLLGAFETELDSAIFSWENAPLDSRQ